MLLTTAGVDEAEGRPLAAGMMRAVPRARRPIGTLGGIKVTLEASPHPILATPFKAVSLRTSPVDQGLGWT